RRAAIAFSSCPCGPPSIPICRRMRSWNTILTAKKFQVGATHPPRYFSLPRCFGKRPETGAVIHCHPPVAVSLIATGKKIVPIHQHSIKFGKGVPVSPWLYGTYYEDGERATKAMGKHFALMMRGHGANVVGDTIQEACLNTVHLERTAKMLLWAQS